MNSLKNKAALFCFSSIAMVAICLRADATVTLQFSDFSNSLTGVSDSAGVTAQNGLTWGIVVDTDGGNSNPPSTFIGQVGLNLADGVDLGNGDLFFFGGSTVSFGIPQKTGSITTVTDLDPYAFTSAGVTAGDRFSVIWFDTGITVGSELLPGTSYGLVSNAGLTLPADGSGTTSYQNLFPITGAVRPANLELIPEPSTALLAFLGMLGLLRRKR